ncbi:MAG: phage tail assembly chaperone [Candidatus Poseidoniales archaeon]
MNLTYTLNEFYPDQWYPFHSPTDTIDDYSYIHWRIENPPSKEEVEEKIQEMRVRHAFTLCREKRNSLLTETDWEVQRNTERNISDQALIDYRNALRDLFQEITQGNIPAPTLNEKNELVFDHWPERLDF